uniref:Uncharacterized protein n=1 Tax=Branchiostoma floridae TaxID=7739 RepID=C3ZMM5_BRAFL|eukprot:XP_002590224.1 hypothetical protein BRAFLDRAFT_97413 [Branchiostoma floridae]
MADNTLPYDPTGGNEVTFPKLARSRQTSTPSNPAFNSSNPFRALSTPPPIPPRLSDSTPRSVHPTHTPRPTRPIPTPSLVASPAPDFHALPSDHAPALSTMPTPPAQVTCRAVLLKHLSGSALQTLVCAPARIRDGSSDQILMFLRDMYMRPQDPMHYRGDIQSLRRQSNETPQAFELRVRQVVALAYPRADQVMREELGVQIFLDKISLDNPILGKEVGKSRPATLHAARDQLQFLEDLEKTAYPSPHGRHFLVVFGSGVLFDLHGQGTILQRQDLVFQLSGVFTDMLYLMKEEDEGRHGQHTRPDRHGHRHHSGRAGSVSAGPAGSFDNVCRLLRAHYQLVARTD